MSNNKMNKDNKKKNKKYTLKVWYTENEKGILKEHKKFEEEKENE